MIIGVLIILLCYVLLISSFIYGFDKINLFESESIEPQIRFSIVVPFRNEAENLELLIESLKKLDYPKTLYEIIFIDDDSTDNSISTIENRLTDSIINWSILKNIKRTMSPKKDAIKIAISNSEFEWILTTDADCITPTKWLKTFDGFIQKNHFSLIAGSVKYQQPKSFLEHFQNLDFLSLIGSTIGSFGIKQPFMANGANLAYKKSFFNELNGFENDLNIASGDDVFLLQNAVKLDANRVAYLKSKNAIVTTKPQPTWNSLFSQRIRWASKSSSYKNSISIFTGIIVLFMNVLIVALSILVLINPTNLTILLFVLILKGVVDYILIYKTSHFLNQKIPVLNFILSSLLYPFFVSYVAFLVSFKGYEWKNRSFDK